MTVKRWCIAAAVVCVGTVSGYGQTPPQPGTGTAAAAAPASLLTPCETADADVLLLRARVMQLEQQLVTAQFETERIRLEAKFRDRLKPPADYVFDWASKTFKAPTPAGQP